MARWCLGSLLSTRSYSAPRCCEGHAAALRASPTGLVRRTPLHCFVPAHVPTLRLLLCHMFDDSGCGRAIGDTHASVQNGSRQCTCKAHRWRANIAAREATGGGCRAVGAHRWGWARPTSGDSVCAWCVACPDSTHLNRGVRPHSAPRAEGSMSTTHGKREACDAYRSEF